jgi:hypothetical protein
MLNRKEIFPIMPQTLFQSARWLHDGQNGAADGGKNPSLSMGYRAQKTIAMVDSKQRPILAAQRHGLAGQLEGLLIDVMIIHEIRNRYMKPHA